MPRAFQALGKGWIFYLLEVPKRMSTKMQFKCVDGGSVSNRSVDGGFSTDMFIFGLLAFSC